METPRPSEDVIITKQFSEQLKILNLFIIAKC